MRRGCPSSTNILLQSTPTARNADFAALAAAAGHGAHLPVATPDSSQFKHPATVPDGGVLGQLLAGWGSAHAVAAAGEALDIAAGGGVAAGLSLCEVRA